MEYDRKKLRWNGWGWAEKRYDLKGRSEVFWDFVRDALGLGALPECPPVSLEAIPLDPPRLEPEVLSALKEAVGARAVMTDRYERVFHAVGKSYHDLLRLRTGRIDAAPDAVVYPASAEAVAAVLAICDRAGVDVVPYGGGSSVVGGVEATGRPDGAGVITVDTSRLDRLLHADPISRTATAQAGIYGPVLERKLGDEGFTLGHYPQSFEFSTLGGWIAARGAGQQSNRYGTMAKLLVSARVATPRGELVTRPFPQSAAGPDLNHVIAGSEGIFGIITEATVRVRPVPPARDARAWIFRDFESGAAAIRDMAQDGVPVAMVRLSDEPETRFFGRFRAAGKPASPAAGVVKAVRGLAGLDTPCAMLVGVEGSAGTVAAGVSRSAVVCMSHGGIPVGSGPARSWFAERFETPYLRDVLLDRGVGVDTLETATVWANVPQLHRAVSDAIDQAIRETHTEPGGRGIVMCHISHSYLDGASLYFTFVFPMAQGAERDQWLRIKRAASDVIVANGGTISHHHGVGADHLPWMEAEKGALGLELLRGAKDRVDPSGILNPGKLLPPR